MMSDLTIITVSLTPTRPSASSTDQLTLCTHGFVWAQSPFIVDLGHYTRSLLVPHLMHWWKMFAARQRPYNARYGAQFTNPPQSIA